MISFKKHSGIYTLEVEQTIPATIEIVWSFFSDPKNLAKITPPEMDFVITSNSSASAYPGQIITYKVGIFPMIKSNWVTEITQVKEYEYFIDEQRFGPYKMWHHEHRFKQQEIGVLMIDKVSYKIPFGFLGNMVHWLFIKRKLRKIFTFRYNYLINNFEN